MMHNLVKSLYFRFSESEGRNCKIVRGSSTIRSRLMATSRRAEVGVSCKLTVE